MRPRLERLMERALPIAVVVVLLNDVFGAVVRYACVSLGAPFLSYAPTLFAVAVLLGTLALGRWHRGVGLLLLIFALHAVYTFLGVPALRGGGLRESATQVVFALYTWTAFFLGALLIARRGESVLVRSALACWLFAVGGVLVNKYVAFPWMETNFEVLGQEVQVARDWSTNGIARLSGFSRASFSAANQIAMFGILLLVNARRSALVNGVIWLVSMLAIALTTSKTPLGSMALAPLAIFGLRFMRNFRASRALSFHAAMGLLGLLLGLVVALPLSTSLAALLAAGPNEDYGFLTLSSLLDRAATMWPGAFELIANDHAPIEWLGGRGLGGIGAAQSLFEPLNTNSADNLFVFLYVTFGVTSGLFVLASMLGFKRFYLDEPETFELLFALAVAVATLGLATNVIESIVPALMSGLVVGKGFCSVTHRGATRQPFTWRGARALLSRRASRIE